MQCSHCESAPSFASEFSRALVSAHRVSGPAQRHFSANAARLEGMSPRAFSDTGRAPNLFLAHLAVTELARASAEARAIGQASTHANGSHGRRDTAHPAPTGRTDGCAPLSSPHA